MSTSPVIIVGADGSSESLEALKWAAARAQVAKWQLHIVCAFALPSFKAATLEGGYVDIDDEAVRHTAEAVVEEAAKYAGEIAPGLQITTQVEAGDPTAVLVELSAQANLMVVGTRGGGGFADRLLGTVSSALPAHAKCPVVVVPRFKGGTPFTPAKRIVVGVDGGASTGRSLRMALLEAVLWGGTVTAVEAVPMASTAGMLAWMPAAVDRESFVADARKRLHQIVADAHQEFPEVTVKAHALDGNAAALMAEFSTNVELIVVGTRGRGGFAGLLLGSTSQAVLSHSQCPVMVVPTRGDLDEGLEQVPWSRG